MVILSLAPGVIVEVHTPMVKGGSVGVADGEPPTTGVTTTFPVFFGAATLSGAWHPTRQIASIASASGIASGRGTQQRAYFAMCSSSRCACRLDSPPPSPDRPAVSSRPDDQWRAGAGEGDCAE